MRCLQLISTKLQHIEKIGPYEDVDSVKDSFIVSSLDLLLGVVQGLGSSVAPYVKKSTLFPLLTVCVHYNARYEVLQPTCTLISDFAKTCFTTLEFYIERIMLELIRQLESEDVAYTFARNNTI
ncbi:hypothetical protein A0J61_06151 [Choanephora cucurbitarum]|uniref:Uncharacterized protein n=1 Tax=Choanephora cucurbitarum TaxID=101091 RepID=A0A1C7N9I4_9FUNG|nr:hypothetical protein A0J61_06151 [Choanephora cucurbitarum]